MLIRIGLENGFEGRRSIAWALDYTGAFAYGRDSSEALLNLPQALVRYEHWVNRHAGEPRLNMSHLDLRLVETWEVYYTNEAFEVVPEGLEINSFFRDDWRPLSEEEVRNGLDLLSWSRADLLAIVGDLPAEKLDQTYEGQRWSIRGILAHVATAEWWYLNRFGLMGERSSLPKDPFQRLEVVRQRLNEVLPSLAGSKQVLGVDGELWSPRKLLRRALWHEMDHIGHIVELL